MADSLHLVASDMLMEEDSASLGPALVMAARAAFLQELQLSVAIRAVDTIGIAILIMVLLRKEGTAVSSETNSDLPAAAQCAADD